MGDIIIVATDAEEPCRMCHNDDLVMNAGTSYHVTPHRRIFTSYHRGMFRCVKIGDNGTTAVVDIGDVHLTTEFDKKLVIKDVRHVSSLRYNLISVERLADGGCRSLFGDRE